MGKKKRRERQRVAEQEAHEQTANAPSGGQSPASVSSTSTASKTRQQSTSTTKQDTSQATKRDNLTYVQATGERKTRANSDVLTGIATDDAKAAGVTDVRTWYELDNRRPVHERDDIPTTIHSRQTDGRGGEKRHRQASSNRLQAVGHFAGGPEFSPAFLRYMARVQPEIAPSSERVECWQWWRIAYVHSRVLAHFTELNDLRAIAAILAIRRDGRDMQTVAERYGLTLTQLARTERKIALFVRNQYKLHGSVPALTQVWRADNSGEVAGPMQTGELAG